MGFFLLEAELSSIETTQKSLTPNKIQQVCGWNYGTLLGSGWEGKNIVHQEIGKREKLSLSPVCKRQYGNADHPQMNLTQKSEEALIIREHFDFHTSVC